MHAHGIHEIVVFYVHFYQTVLKLNINHCYFDNQW